MNCQQIGDYRPPQPSSTDIESSNHNYQNPNSRIGDSSYYSLNELSHQNKLPINKQSSSDLKDDLQQPINNNNNTNKCNNNNKAQVIKCEILPTIKTESSSCKSPIKIVQQQRGFETYINQDSNSSSVSSIDNSTNKQQQSHQQQQQQQQHFQPHQQHQQQQQNHLTTHHNGYPSLNLDSSQNPPTMMSGLSVDDPYLREHQLRYSQMQDIARPTVSYASEIAVSRAVAAGYELPGHRPYDPGVVSISSTAFERYDPNCPPQRPNMYPYIQHNMDELESQHKYLQEQQQQHMIIMKQQQEMDENSGPIYPRPMYHYDPTSGALPPGFSAINLSVKVPTSSLHKNGGSPSPVGPVIDLSTSSVTSSSPHNFNSPHYIGHRITGSPQPGSSPHLTSPQVPSPQTLDLSVNRLPHR